MGLKNLEKNTEETGGAPETQLEISLLLVYLTLFVLFHICSLALLVVLRTTT